MGQPLVWHSTLFVKPFRHGVGISTGRVASECASSIPSQSPVCSRMSAISISCIICGVNILIDLLSMESHWPIVSFGFVCVYVCALSLSWSLSQWDSVEGCTPCLHCGHVCLSVCVCASVQTGLPIQSLTMFLNDATLDYFTYSFRSIGFIVLQHPFKYFLCLWRFSWMWNNSRYYSVLRSFFKKRFFRNSIWK